MIRRRGAATTGRGQSLVEFALLLPLLLAIIFGVIDFGRSIFQYSTLSEGARQAGRLAVVDQTIAAIKAEAISRSAGIKLDPDPNGVRTCFKDSSISGAQLACSITTSSTLCEGGTVVTIGCLAVVETQSTFRALTPVISNWVGDIVLTSRSVNPIENVCSGTCP